MFQQVKTLNDFILSEEQKSPSATGSFTLVLTQIENAVKIIGSHVKSTGLVDILGTTGKKNVYSEDVQKLDEFSNNLLVKTLIDSGQVHAVLSEELEEPVVSTHNKGKYVVCIDPLDGSSNIDTNGPIGTIFSIYHKADSLLQEGTKQVAAGYVLYGPSIVLVYSSGNGVNGFTLDPAIGSFLLSSEDIKIPKKGDIYSINEGNSIYFTKETSGYIEYVKKDGAYKGRYIGSMVADVHRTLMKGGIFLYPADKKSEKGKLRLLFEVNPMSFLVTQAGGKATSGKTDPLLIKPEAVSQKAPIVLGSPDNVEEYFSFLQ